MKGSRESQGWGNKRVQFQEPYNKMPKSSGAWKPGVPFWEREFCESVGLSWNQVCDNNNELEGFEHILRWDDCAALEAFQMAKQRYWAQRNNLPCDIPLPSPDLYVEEIDWDTPVQGDCEVPERNYSSSEEEYRRPYFKRGRKGRQGRGRNMSRLETREHRKAADGNAQSSANMVVPSGWPDSNSNTPKDAQMAGSMEWGENKQNKTQDPGNVAIIPTGWEEQHDSGWGVKETDYSGWEAHGNNNTGWEQKMDSGWGNQTEPTRNSTVTSNNGWTDSGNVKNSVGWGDQGDQTQNGWIVGTSGSGWTPCEEDNYTGQGWGNENSGWGSKPVGRTGWSNVKNVSGWESGTGHVSSFIPQEQVISTGWGDHYYQNQAYMPAQWNPPQATQQWHNQPTAWNAGPADTQYQFNGNWGGTPCHSFHQGGSQGWFQPPAYPQSAWRPIQSNQGYWHPVSQHKQGGYPAPNHHYAFKKDKDYRANNRRNQR